MARFKRLRPGAPISAREDDRVKRGVEGLQRVSGVSGLRTGPIPTITPQGVRHTSSVYQPFWARIIGKGKPALTQLENDLAPEDTIVHATPVAGWFLEWPYFVMIDGEIMEVVDTDGEFGKEPGFTWKVRRGRVGTIPAPHYTGRLLSPTERILPAIIESVWIPYAFTEVRQSINGIWETHNDGRRSSSGGDEIIVPAFEASGIQRVPDDGGAIVLMWLGHDETYYLFSWAPIPSDTDPPTTPVGPLAGSPLTGILIGINNFTPPAANRGLVTVQDDRYSTELTIAVTATAGAITVRGTALFPLDALPFRIQINSEIMLVTEISPLGHVWNVTRAHSGTIAAVHFAYAQVTWIDAVTTTLATTLTPDTTTLVVASFEKFPTDNRFFIQIDKEYMLVVQGAGTTAWIVERGVEGTTKAGHGPGATVRFIVPELGRIGTMVFKGYSFVSPGSHPREAIHHEVYQLCRPDPGVPATEDGLIPARTRKWQRKADDTGYELVDDEFIWLWRPDD